METIKNRYEFVLLFDVQDGNPNGDPDAGNLPRVDPETGMGLVTDVCLKRKVRNYVQMVHGCQKPNDIFIKEKAILNRLISDAHDQDAVKAEQDDGKKTEAARQWMCANYYDVRTFGAVMSTGEKEKDKSDTEDTEDDTKNKKSIKKDKSKGKRKNAGQVRGPIQMTFARSVLPVVALEHSITRMAVTTEKKAEEQKGDNRTMGLKYTISYGLYRAHGFISAFLANQTGFSTADLELFWDSLLNMFDHDRSAARGLMGTRTLYVFEHKTALGSMPAQDIFDTVKVKKISPEDQPARAFSDFSVTVDESVLQNSEVKLIRKRG